MIRFLAPLLLISCSKPPPDPRPRINELLAILSTPNQDKPGHGKYHKADNGLQRELWMRLEAFPTAPDTAKVLLAAVEKVYLGYHANYYNGTLYHWPYLSSLRAVALCDRILALDDRDVTERTLWLKAFALRAPSVEAWAEAEKDLETYAEQVKWLQDFAGAREIYARLAREFSNVRATQLKDAVDLTVILPTGPREQDPRE